MPQYGRFQIDDSVPEELRTEIVDRVKANLDKMKSETADREPIIKKRQDFFEGRHHRWTNVTGQVIKEQEGHILAVFNYVLRFCQKVHQTLTNNPPRIKIKSRDEANEVETSRSEMVEDVIYDILNKNKFFPVIFKRCAINQIRDGDFMFECKVMEDLKGKRIQLAPMEDLLKISVGWDNASGTSFSFISFTDMWSIEKIKREFGYEAEPLSDTALLSEGSGKGDHLKDQYGLMSDTSGSGSAVPTGENKLPKAKITDYWGYEVIDSKVKVVNMVFINNENVQFVVTEYDTIPKFIGHSLLVAGKPWSMSFIDPLMDPQIELNDRSSEEGDMIRLGSHMKFLAINMTNDFDADGIKPGSGQVIFVEGENADFRPLQMSISPFPSADYINRTMEHLFTLGIPKISLAAGTAPYTGKVGAIQYQPFADLIGDYRIQWEVVMSQLVETIQQYLIKFFPETHTFMKESLMDETTGEMSDGELIVREVEFDWDNVLPLSRSDKVVDAATLRDRGLISVSTTLEEAGFRDPGKEIKKLKKEAKDKELMAMMPKFQQFSPGVVKAQLETRQVMMAAEEANAETMGLASEAGKGTTPAPILNQSQNDGKRGVLSATGTPTGQTASAKGAVAQAGQNLNAQAGV